MSRLLARLAIASLLFLCGSSGATAELSRSEPFADFDLAGGGAATLDSVEVSRQWLDRLSAAELEQELSDRPDLLQQVVSTLASAIGEGPADLSRSLEEYVVELTRERSWRLSGAHRIDYSDDEAAEVVALLIGDPRRFAEEPKFRLRTQARWPESLSPETSPPLARRILSLLREEHGVDIETIDRLAKDWAVGERASSERWRSGAVPADPAGPGWRAPDPDEPIAASIYSLRSDLISPPAARAFLNGVRAAAPGRALIVLVDRTLAAELGKLAQRIDVVLVDSLGESFSPWPRDPLLVTRRPDGGVHFLLRPTRQRTREADSLMGPALVRSLPRSLDRLWGEPTWSWSSVGFHNGQVLLTENEAWIGIHGVEPRALEILGLDRVPVEEFGRPQGVARYVEAARQTARELEEIYGRPVRFIDPVPEGDLPSPAAIGRLAGGAGFDLDSLVTLLPAGPGRKVALVGDLTAGAELIEQAAPSELRGFKALYGLAGEPPELRRRLEAAQAAPRAAALQTYLDAIEQRLAALTEVRRIPLLLIPRSLNEMGTADRVGPDFLVSWNNVVLEEDGNVRRAEGFGSGLPTGDARARRLFASAGYRLDLVPPLAESILRNGGYRCASVHVRVPAEARRSLRARGLAPEADAPSP